MRTTLTIPDDVLQAARERAEVNGTTIGEALADLARKGLERETLSQPDDFWKGVRFFQHHPDDPPVSMETINRLRDVLP